MPRGRAGLTLIPADQVSAAVLGAPAGWSMYYRSPARARRIAAAAVHFQVTTRTVRRWLERGLPLYWGTNPSRDEWDAFVRAGRADPASDKCRSTLVTPQIRDVTNVRRRQ